MGPEEFLQCRKARALLHERSLLTDAGIRAVVAITGHLTWHVVGMTTLTLVAALLMQRMAIAGTVHRPVYIQAGRDDLEFGAARLTY